jgi:hypothetical protein
MFDIIVKLYNYNIFEDVFTLVFCYHYFPKGIKLASAGVERLVLKDAERQTHSDG